MTDSSWCIWLSKFVVKHDLPKEAKDEIVSKMEDIEKEMESRSVIVQPMPTRVITPQPMAQAPSTQRILAEMATEANSNPIMPQPLTRATMPKPSLGVDKETGRAMIQTGKGTLGPRKF